jgi:hypothetical protein
LEQDFLEHLNGSSLDTVGLIMAIDEVLGDCVSLRMREKSAAFELCNKPLTTSEETEA